MNEKILIVLRGVSGSGKTSVAHLFNGYMVAADDYFIDDYGNYRFDASRLHEAHIYCKEKVQRWMQFDNTPIVVHNTNTLEREIKPYFDLADRYGYKVFSLIVENRHGSSDIHGVPHDTKVKQEIRLMDSIRLK